MSNRKDAEVIRASKLVKAAFDLWLSDLRIQQDNPQMKQSQALRELFERHEPEYLERARKLRPDFDEEESEGDA